MTGDGELQVQSLRPVVLFDTDMRSFVGLFAGQIEPEEATAGGLIRIEGDPGALRRFLKMTGVPVKESPIEASAGILAGGGKPLTQALLDDHEQELESERARTAPSPERGRRRRGG